MGHFTDFGVPPNFGVPQFCQFRGIKNDPFLDHFFSIFLTCWKFKLPWLVILHHAKTWSVFFRFFLVLKKPSDYVRAACHRLFSWIWTIRWKSVCLDFIYFWRKLFHAFWKIEQNLIKTCQDLSILVSPNSKPRDFAQVATWQKWPQNRRFSKMHAFDA